MNSGYIPVELRRLVRQDAKRQCGYCLSPEVLLGLSLEIEHLMPQAAGGLTIRGNLWLACRRCNQFKRDLTQAPDPQSDEVVTFRTYAVGGVRRDLTGFLKTCQVWSSA